MVDAEKLLVKIAECFDGHCEPLGNYLDLNGKVAKLLVDADYLEKSERGSYSLPSLEIYLVFEKIRDVVQKQPPNSGISKITYEELRDTKVRVEATSFAQARRKVRELHPELRNIPDENLRVVLT